MYNEKNEQCQSSPCLKNGSHRERENYAIYIYIYTSNINNNSIIYIYIYIYNSDKYMGKGKTIYSFKNLHLYLLGYLYFQTIVHQYFCQVPIFSSNHCSSILLLVYLYFQPIIVHQHFRTISKLIFGLQ